MPVEGILKPVLQATWRACHQPVVIVSVLQLAKLFQGGGASTLKLFTTGLIRNAVFSSFSTQTHRLRVG